MKHLPINLNILRRVAMTLVAVVAMAGMSSCEDEESALGMNLADPTTLYEGKTHTLYPDAAWSQTEDSLLTSNYSFCILGSITDAVFGKTTSVLYTQVALPSETRELDFSAIQIDSIVLSLVKYRLQPDTAGSYRMHFEVKQLAEAIENDKRYYSTDALPVQEDKVLYDGMVTVTYGDSVVRLPLDTAVAKPILTQVDSAAAFAAQVKGLRIRLADGSDNGMISLDLSSTESCITVYYHYDYEDEVVFHDFSFIIGGASHFTQFIHDYTGTVFAGSDRTDGDHRLYLEPMGGHNIHLSFDTALQAFYREHPLAVIHHAELLLPLAPESSALHPERVLALEKITVDSLTYIDDLVDLYTLSGFDGKYHADKNHYRLRVTQHLQGLMRQGRDNGMQLLLDARRHTANHAVVNGIANTEISPKIVFVYSE